MFLIKKLQYLGNQVRHPKSAYWVIFRNVLNTQDYYTLYLRIYIIFNSLIFSVTSIKTHNIKKQIIMDNFINKLAT